MRSCLYMIRRDKSPCIKSGGPHNAATITRMATGISTAAVYNKCDKRLKKEAPPASLGQLMTTE